MITKPSEIYFKDGVWAWDAVNSTWVRLEVDASGYLKVVVSDTAGLKASDLNLDGAKDLQVDVKTSALPTGAATSAKQNQLEGWDGAAWRKLPMVWGYSDRYAEELSNTSVSAGSSNVDGSTVPAGEVWRVVGASALVVSASCTSFRLYYVAGGSALVLDVQLSPTTSQWYIFSLDITLKAGDLARARFYGMTLNDDVYVNLWGYKMKVAE